MAVFLIWVILGLPAMIWRGYVLYMLWGWFIAPLGLITIGIAHALGISTLVSLFTLTLTDVKQNAALDKHKDQMARAVESITIGLAAPLLALFWGWIFHLFM